MVRLTKRRRSACARRMTLTLRLGGPKTVRILGPSFSEWVVSKAGFYRHRASMNDIRSPAVCRTFRHRETFMPFLWEQNGTGPNMVVYHFGSWRRFLEAAREPSRPQHALHDPVQQDLSPVRAVCRFFKGMRFEDLRRMQIDIETSLSAEYAFSNPERDPLSGYRAE